MHDRELRFNCTIGGTRLLPWILFVFACLVFHRSDAQQWTFATADPKLEALYGSKDWQGVLAVGDSALAHGVDYSRLRTYMGVACYLTGRPFSAVGHLEKALALDSGNRLARTYLVYAYRATEREWDALRLGRKQDPAFQSALGLKPLMPLTDVYLEGGARWSDMPDRVGAMPFGVLALGHRFLPELGLTHGLSYLEMNFFGTSLRQFDYFAQIPTAVARGVVLRPFGHFARVNGEASGSYQTPITNEEYSERIVQDNLFAGLSAKIHCGRLTLRPMIVYGLQRDDIRTVVQVGYTVFDSSRTDTFRTVTTTSLQQFNLGTTYTLPVWKNRLQLQAEGVLHRTDTAMHFGWKAGIRIQPLPRLYTSIEFARLQGLRNFVEADGIVLNNSLSEILQRVSLYGYYVLSPKISLMLVGIWDTRRYDLLDFQNYTFVTTLKFSL
jgi:hypothetical protein